MSPKPPRKGMSSAGFSEPAFREVGELAHALAGLVFPPNRQPSAEAGMRRAMATLRISSADALLRAVSSPGDARDTLLAELTVGESYFFRDEPMVRHIMGQLIARRSAQDSPRHLRFWSAGCASGEEPYTLAILLRELGWTNSADILATDIALPRLEAARRGKYTRWALRGASDARIERWFAREGTHYVLDREIRGSVEFRHLNLTHDEYPTPESGTGNRDLILCRNVMIYFDLTTAARVAQHLLASLAPDGWLLLGASDPPLAQLVECDVAMTEWGVAYRRLGNASALPALGPSFSWTFEPPATPVYVPVQTPPEMPALPLAPLATQAPAPAAAITAPALAFGAPEILAAYQRADYRGTETLAAEYLATNGADASSLPAWIAYVRAVANQGRLPEAGELCSRALELHPMSAELHYLHAMLLAEASWMPDAIAAARRAIYLDRRLTMGHLLLGDLLARQGDVVAARRTLENAIDSLARVDATLPVPASDGVPAARLLHIAQSRLAKLAEARSA